MIRTIYEAGCDRCGKWSGVTDVDRDCALLRSGMVDFELTEKDGGTVVLCRDCISVRIARVGGAQ